MNSFSHIPVLLEATLHSLQIKKGKKYIDATIGGGGHAAEILQKGGKVLGIDQDKNAIEHLEKKFKQENNITLVQDNFKNIEKIARKHNFYKADGILFDLGVSSHQIDTPSRGFSHRFDASLDMRMGESRKSAFDVVNKYTEKELQEVFSKYGELEQAELIAKNIVLARKKEPIRTTQELVKKLSHNSSLSTGQLSRIFQAIRIEVNDEIEVIKDTLPAAFNILDTKGRLAVIAFHSLEDRQVKILFQKLSKEKKGRIVTKKPITAVREEILHNRRARSAKLRVIEKI